MPQEYDVPVRREDLTFAVKMARHKTDYLRPKRRRPGNHDRLELVAEAGMAARPLLPLARRRHLRARILPRNPRRDGAAGGTVPDASINRMARSGVVR